MPNKGRLLFLLQLLQEQSDEEHSLNTTEIRQAFQANGCPATVQTIRDDIKTLRDAGYQIISHERNGIVTSYCYVGRVFEPPELQILIDAVASSQFITKTKSYTLIRKIANMSGPSHRDELQPGILISERMKAPNTQINTIVRKIKEGINKNRKICFKYYDYDLNVQRVARHNGENYYVSPYATVWKNDRYYFLGYSDKHEKVVAFRIDRMDVPRLIMQERVPEPDNYSTTDYTEKAFKMYGGKEEDVTLRCQNEMMNHIIDYFGRNVEVNRFGETIFEVTVPVSASKTFYSWIMQYAGQIVIAAPETIRTEYQQALKKALEMSENIADGYIQKSGEGEKAE